MPDIPDSRELSAWGSSDIGKETGELVSHVLAEPKIATMDKKLIIEASTPGHYPRLLWEHFGIKNMPPSSVDEQAKSIIECAKAGAAAIHTHPRDDSTESGELGVRGDLLPQLTAKVLDMVYPEVDIVPLSHAWHPRNWEDLAEADFATPTQALLEIGQGNKYIQGNVVPTWINPRSRRGLLSSWFTADSLKDGIRYLEENHVKPLIALHLDHLIWFKSNIIDAGVMKTRPHLNIQEGKHGVNRLFADPTSHLNLISGIEMVRKIVPDCTLGIHLGGRNWLPMTVLGIMLGVDLVRVGIEDQFWAYPHRDEIIMKPSESVERIVQIAKTLGRDIATPAEAREILGIQVSRGVGGFQKSEV